MASDILQKVKG